MWFMYICIVVFTVMQSTAVKLYNRSNDNVIPFNTVKASAAFLLFAFMSIAGFKLHTGTVVYGSLYGLLSCISMYAGYKALSIGPMALTSLIVSFSIVIPLLSGVIYFDEHLNTLNVIGFIFLIIALVFVNLKKTQMPNGNKGSLKWTLFVATTFLANGFCSVLQKAHQIRYKSMYCSEFMLHAMLICSLIFIIITAKNSFKNIKLNEIKYGTLSGVSNAIAGYLTIKLAGFENASILFPAISAGTILCTLIIGVAFFKEKLRYNHFIAIFAGIAAVVFLKL